MTISNHNLNNTPPRARLLRREVLRGGGTNGVSTNGVTANVCFSTEGLFRYSR